jgi:hypothetical protein
MIRSKLREGTEENGTLKASLPYPVASIAELAAQPSDLWPTGTHLDPTDQASVD